MADDIVWRRVSGDDRVDLMVRGRQQILRNDVCEHDVAVASELQELLIGEHPRDGSSPRRRCPANFGHRLRVRAERAVRRRRSGTSDRRAVLGQS